MPALPHRGQEGRPHEVARINERAVGLGDKPVGDPVHIGVRVLGLARVPQDARTTAAYFVGSGAVRLPATAGGLHLIAPHESKRKENGVLEAPAAPLTRDLGYGDRRRRPQPAETRRGGPPEALGPEDLRYEGQRGLAPPRPQLRHAHERIADHLCVIH